MFPLIHNPPPIRIKKMIAKKINQNVKRPLSVTSYINYCNSNNNYVERCIIYSLLQFVFTLLSEVNNVVENEKFFFSLIARKNSKWNCRRGKNVYIDEQPLVQGTIDRLTHSSYFYPFFIL